MKFIKKVIRGNYTLFELSRELYEFTRRGRGGVQIINKGCAKLEKNCIGDNNQVFIGAGSILHATEIYIRGNNVNIKIGENVIIGKRSSIRCEGDNISISIGDNTTMTRDVHICAQEEGTSITIGNDCMFSNNIIVRTSDSHPIYGNTGERLNKAASVAIGNHVWIAPETTIMKGVIVGNNSILGSKSMVTKNIPNDCLAVGIPAKPVRYEVQWTREKLF